MRNILALAVLLAGTSALHAQAPIVRPNQTQDQPQTPNQTQDQAQGQGMHHHKSPQHETKMMTRKLGLSADQAAQVEPILADRQQRMEALHANTALTPQQMHQQGRSIMEDSRQKLDAVLTESQRQQLAQMQAEHHHHGHQPAQTQQPNA